MNHEDEVVVPVPEIEKYESTYKNEIQDLERFLRHVHVTCEELLRGRIQASVTSRVKTWKSLRKKLYKRNVEKQYPNPEHIKNDVETLDIVGARIRAFFPKQLQSIYAIVKDSFAVSRDRPFDPDWKDKDKLPAYSEKFGNYEGTHYWVTLKNNDTAHPLEARLWEKFKNQIFEIQVRSSMLLDGWAEVRHDIT